MSTPKKNGKFPQHQRLLDITDHSGQIGHDKCQPYSIIEHLIIYGDFDPSDDNRHSFWSIHIFHLVMMFASKWKKLCIKNSKLIQHKAKMNRFENFKLIFSLIKINYNCTFSAGSWFWFWLLLRPSFGRLYCPNQSFQEGDQLFSILAAHLNPL